MAHKAEQRRRFKAVLCAKPRTYSRIRGERKRAEDQGVRMTASHFDEEEDEEEDKPVLDGYFLVWKDFLFLFGIQSTPLIDPYSGPGGWGGL